MKILRLDIDRRRRRGSVSGLRQQRHRLLVGGEAAAERPGHIGLFRPAHGGHRRCGDKDGDQHFPETHGQRPARDARPAARSHPFQTVSFLG